MASSKPVVIVTGAARGIGKGCALELARTGFNVLINDLPDPVSVEKLKTVQHECESLGAEVVCFSANVADLDLHEVMLDTAENKWGRLDCLLNNAGISVKSRGDLLDMKPDSFDENFAVNTRAPFFLSQAFSHRLLKTPGNKDVHRSIIFISSINAVMLAMNRGEYTMAKTAVSVAARLFAIRLVKEGIGVYEVRPGLIKTDMTIPATAYYDELISKGLVPQGRWGYPEDIASTVRAMAEGKLIYTCGQAIEVDGGLSVSRF
ncbi:3-ketoacyl-ACP reductase [Citrobacter freundii]|uniref:3-ketoacyl-ACP reductase n=1 Tax=Citrobacter freundii TaxID=546 RepID=UPI0024E10546|nr:3-ketoacyl-ACP reductase [Citrobacter freundii]EKV5092616.1 3-ketoacyl-ACP reductase [Citrobacter freundii]ELN4556639.1 3-ketoacyl-ACP reductase [Citrobacter freundii]MDT7261828.1 3-ketoacyl-ACP reductase [Citrobacter freundii]WOR59848.1 3-ketoacyl-ACP reductase [Citrobacter freundii]HBM8272635.1 3-ketoacyl-ACP reductase [Citrobacter freundii]